MMIRRLTSHPYLSCTHTLNMSSSPLHTKPASTYHVLENSSHHSQIILQSIHFMWNSALQIVFLGRSCKHLVFQMSPKEIIAGREIRRSWMPFYLMVQGNDSISQEFSESISDSDETMCRGTVLDLPELSEDSSNLSLKFVPSLLPKLTKMLFKGAMFKDKEFSQHQALVQGFNSALALSSSSQKIAKSGICTCCLQHQFIWSSMVPVVQKGYQLKAGKFLFHIQVDSNC